ncbi:MAG: DUF3619 family protein [Betaproteobacteria bacterium]|nr:DUF3619 family protein [Betaproteobacteria bacterium]
MTIKDDDFAKKLTGYLDRGALELKAGTAYRLQLAREAALARLTQPQRASELQVVHAGGVGVSAGRDSGRGNIWRSARLWSGILLIVATGFAYNEWLNFQQLSENEELDAQILSSDLPIDAYLDRGFQNWLTREDR